MNAAQHGKTASSAWGWEEGACRQTGHAAKEGKANSGVTSPRRGEEGGEGICSNGARWHRLRGRSNHHRRQRCAVTMEGAR